MKVKLLAYLFTGSAVALGAAYNYREPLIRAAANAIYKAKNNSPSTEIPKLENPSTQDEAGSTKDLNAQYMKAVQNGNSELQQKLLEEMDKDRNKPVD